MEPLRDGQPGEHECWEEYAEHSLTHDDLPPVTMADLAPGTRVRHIHWDLCGRIREAGDITEIAWDGSFVQDEVSPEGVVFPSDLEILGQAR